MAYKFGWEIFNKALSGENIECTVSDLFVFVQDELQINLEQFDKINKKSISLLVPLLAKQCSAWDPNRWKRTKDEMFNEFIDNLRYNIRAIIDLDDGKWSSNKDDDEYTLTIYCSPETLNTLICTDQGNDILFKTHCQEHWTEVGADRIINWPFIKVLFTSADLMFTRDVCVEYHRYINFIRCNYRATKTPILESAEQIGPTRTVFSCGVLEAYVREYLQVLKEKQAPAHKLSVIATVLQNFIQDIKLMNVEPPLQTIATDTQVCVRLNIEYVRNKKLSKDENDTRQVGFCEILNPKVRLLLNYFRGKMKTLQPPLFDLATDFKDKPLQEILPKMIFKCQFCDEEFVKEDTFGFLRVHLYSQHKMEHPVRCLACKQAFSMSDLAGCRWRHACPIVNNR